MLVHLVLLVHLEQIYVCWAYAINPKIKMAFIQISSQFNQKNNFCFWFDKLFKD